MYACVFVPVWVWDLKSRQRIDLGVVEQNGLEGSTVTVLNNSHSCSWEHKQPRLQQVSSHLVKLFFLTMHRLILKSFKKQGNMCMNKCRSTCIWLGIFGKGSQSVDGVDDKVLLQGEVSQTHWLWAVDHKHNVHGSAAFLTVCRQKHKLWESNSRSERVQIMIGNMEVTKLTTAAACLPNVVHDITFLQE